MKPAIAAFITALLAVAAPAVVAAERFPRAAPESEGVDSVRLLACIEALDTGIDSVHSFMLLRRGKVVAEGWWGPYAAEHNHVLYSLSKSFTATAVGIAAAEGRLSIDDLVVKFFPDDVPEDPGRHLMQMRIRDLLTMSAGHETPPSADADTVTPKSFLAAEVPRRPGSHFRYNTAATFMLSAIVEKQTGEKLVDYLRPRLLDPLGIDEPVWDENAQGIALGGYGLRVRTEDIAALGQLYLRKGDWRGRRLLTGEWVAHATARQVSNGSDPKSDWAQGYGFQFWRCRHGAYRGDGAFGQFCIVLPEQDAVVAITSGTGNMGGIMNILWDKLLPAFHDMPLEENGDAVAALEAKLGSLRVPMPDGKRTSPRWEDVAGGTWRFPDNDDRIEALTLRADEQGRVTMTLRIAGDDTAVHCGHGSWFVSGKAKKREADPEPLAASFAWTAGDVLTVRSCAYETPFVTTCTLRFKEDGGVAFERKVNVGFGGAKAVRLAGERE